MCHLVTCLAVRERPWQPGFALPAATLAARANQGFDERRTNRSVFATTTSAGH